jgi:hypothetical protein
MPVHRRKLRVRLLPALCVAALAVLALGAGTAQAHEWTVKGTPLSKQGGKMGISGKSSESINFNWSALEGNFSWRCNSATESATAEVGGVSQATIRFSECAFTKVPKVCHMNSVVETTVSTKVAEVTFEGKPTTFEVYSTLSGKGLKVEIQGAECSIAPNTWELNGSFASRIDGVERISQPRTFSKANQVGGGFLLGPAPGPLYIEGGWSEAVAPGPLLGYAWLLS